MKSLTKTAPYRESELFGRSRPVQEELLRKRRSLSLSGLFAGLSPCGIAVRMVNSSVYSQYRDAFVNALAEALSVPAEQIAGQVKDAEPEHGDLSFPTFSLAKTQRKAPPAIAQSLVLQLKIPNLELKAVGPYVNARFSAAPYAASVIAAVRSQKQRYGSSDLGRGQTIVIDYSSPNIAKPIAFHHIRSTMIGHAVANLARSQGYTVVGINYLGDWGMQFGMVATGLTEFGDPARQNEMAHLVEVYVKASARAKEDPIFEAKARDFFRRMELGDADALALWQKLRDVSLADFRKVYDRLGIEFESYEGESLYQDKMEPVIDEISRTVGTKMSQGALIVDMPYADNEPAVRLRRDDGSTLYATRDFAAAIDRYQRFHFAKSLYLVATEQSLHFKQLFAVLERMGKPWAKDCIHVNFGRVHGMSTRRGEIVLLTDVLDEAKNRALEKVLENQKSGRISTGNPDVLAEQIGLGAIVFGDLKNRRITDYDFKLEEFLSFEGHTGPYLQYSHARCCNILAKAGVPNDAAFDASVLTLPEEKSLVAMLGRFPEAVREALEHYEPSVVSRHLLEVAAAFSRWYTLGNQEREKRVLVENNEPVRVARLALTEAVKHTLGAGLHLLGIAAPENM